MCKRCGINPQGTTKPYCKSCKNSIAKAWRLRTGKKYKEYFRDYRNSHRGLPVVYAYFDQQGKAIYVGRGSAKRSLWHKRDKWWSAELLLISMTCKDEWEAMELEGRWGGRYRPCENKDGYRYK